MIDLQKPLESDGLHEITTNPTNVWSSLCRRNDSRNRTIRISQPLAEEAPKADEALTLQMHRSLLDADVVMRSKGRRNFGSSGYHFVPFFRSRINEVLVIDTEEFLRREPWSRGFDSVLHLFTYRLNGRAVRCGPGLTGRRRGHAAGDTESKLAYCESRRIHG